MKAPTMRPDGTCSACIGGWLCKWHQQEGLRRDREKSKVIRLAAEGHRRNALLRIAAEHELESDEFHTWEEKAKPILAGGAS